MEKEPNSGSVKGDETKTRSKEALFQLLNFCFDGLTGDCLWAELWARNVYTSRQVVRFIGPVQPRNVIRFYFQHGHMENFIKEAKNGFACDKMSSTDFEANTVKLQLVMLAYNFNN